MPSQNQKSQVAFNACKDQLHRSYAIGSYVAFDDGELIAAAADDGIWGRSRVLLGSPVKWRLVTCHWV